MSHRFHRFPLGIAAVIALGLFMAPTPVSAGSGIGPSLDAADVNWEKPTPASVHFTLRFRNLSTFDTSEPAAGTVHAQPFGVFLPDGPLIHTFNVPPMLPNSFFDVFFDVPLCDLPGGCGPGPTMAPASLPCPPFDHWDGNVDIRWNGPGGPGVIVKHIGWQPQVCPGRGTSYTHVVTNCPFPAPWVIAGVCAGWTVTLVNENLTPALNPVPPFWTGFICVSANANVAIGSVCCFTVTFTCQGVPGVINFCARACDCPVPAVPSTWSHIKAMYD